MRLGRRIKALRRKRGLTQPALAARVGIHRVSLARVEGGSRTLSLATLEKLAKALRVSVAELLR